MRWFALHLPQLPLEALHTTAPAAVLVQRRVLLADAVALAAGVQPDMSAGTALSVLPGLHLHARNKALEGALLQRLALALLRYTPTLVLQPDGLWLEVSRTTRLFGGVRALAQAVLATARACGVNEIHAAAAPTATAAGLKARLNAPREALDALPLAPALAALGQEERLAQLLHGIGCRTLGDVRALPSVGLQRRGGVALQQALARAHGIAPDPQPLYEPPLQFAQSLELAHRADDAAMLVFAAQRLVEPLAGWLALNWLAATRLSLHLRHERSVRTEPLPPTVLVVELGRPSREATQMVLLLRERLQRLALPAPVYAMTLMLDAAQPHAGEGAALWPELPDAQRDAQGFAALLDRLSARLGRERVRSLALHDDHRPECAMRWVEAAQAVQQGAIPSRLGQSERAEGAEGMAVRPTWLLPSPEPLAEHQGLPLHDGQTLQLLTPAERIEAGWFDGQPVARDYHVARGTDERLRWVFHERQGAGDAPPRWFLHGFFG
jgi:protein ImuB